MTTAITPTIGRIILFIAAADLGHAQGDTPFPAIVSAVNEDGTINVTAFPAPGAPFAALHVPIIDTDEVINHTEGHVAYWMPYQLQAAATTPAKS